MSSTCFAAGCGRVHEIEQLSGAWDVADFCAYHRAELELGTCVECRNDDTAWYDAQDGLILLPPKWEPTSPSPDLNMHEGWHPGEDRDFLDDAISRVRGNARKVERS